MGSKAHGIIYKATNIVNGKIYIGQTIKSLKTRKNAHVSDALSVNDNNYFHSAIKKYGTKNFNWETIDRNDNREKLNLLEVFYIGYYDTFVGRGYNLNAGGNGNFGFSPSKETRKKLSLANSGKDNPMYGKKHSDEAIKKMSIAATGKRSGKNNPNYGKKHSKETRKKISEALMGKRVGEKNHNFGKPLSDETKRKLSIALTGKCSPMRGKHHSDETKRKLSEAKMGKYKGKDSPHAHAVIIGDKYFDTRDQAAEFVGVSPSLIRKRILYKTKWIDYHYA